MPTEHSTIPSAQCHEPKHISGATTADAGKVITPSLTEQAADVAAKECSPITDTRASTEYRREMVKVFTRRAISEAIDAAQNPRPSL